MKSLAILALACRIAYAEPPAEVTADQAVALAREQPRATARRAAIDVTAADLVDARIYPNPTLGVSVGRTVQGIPTSGDSLYTADLGIPILIGRQRDHREDAARAAIAAKRLDVAADQASSELEIRARFVALQAAQQKSATLAAAVDDARAVRVIVAGRASAGANSPYALERIDLAIAALSSKLDEAEGDREAASGELAGAVGIASWHPHAIGELRPAGAAPPSAIDLAHPILAASRAAEAAARAGEQRARADGVPTPSLALQSYHSRGPEGIGLIIGIEIPLPLFDRNQGAVARAHAEAHRAELEGSARSIELAGTLDRASRVLAGRRDALARFEANALERLPRIRTMAESAYRSGQGGIVELLDALDAITEAKLRELELVASVVNAELAIRSAAVGR